MMVLYVLVPRAEPPELTGMEPISLAISKPFEHTIRHDYTEKLPHKDSVRIHRPINNSRLNISHRTHSGCLGGRIAPVL